MRVALGFDLVGSTLGWGPRIRDWGESAMGGVVW